MEQHHQSQEHQIYSPKMDTNPGEATNEDSIPDLTQRRNCAEDEESDDENDDDEDIEELLLLDMKGDPKNYLED
eukprot:6155212-Ditylum_brightwellii.AAC.1